MNAQSSQTALKPIAVPDAVVTDAVPGQGRVQILNDPSWIAPIMALHTRVRREMADGDRAFLLPKPVEYFRDLLDGQGGVLFGAVVGGQLAGIVAVVQAPCFSVAKMRGLVTYSDPDGAMESSCGVDDVGVIQSLCVLKDWAGQGFSRVLIGAAAAWADKQGIAHLFAQVAEANSPCWLRFMEQDFGIVARWTHGHARYLVKKAKAKDKQKKLLQAAPDARHMVTLNYGTLVADLEQLMARMAPGAAIYMDRAAGKDAPFVLTRA